MNFRRSKTVGRNLSFYKIGWDDFLLYGPGWDAFGPGWILGQGETSIGMHLAILCTLGSGEPLSGSHDAKRRSLSESNPKFQLLNSTMMMKHCE